MFINTFAPIAANKSYATLDLAPAPTTDKFVCVTTGAPYHDPIRSDDYEQRRHCEIMEHVNDVVRATCDGKAMANVLDVGKIQTRMHVHIN
jgi:hypothetical protein